MANPTLDDTCYRVDVLEMVLNQKALSYNSAEDPLEATHIGYCVTEPQAWETKEYGRLLSASTTYTHEQSLKEVLSVSAQTSQGKEKSTSKVELKPLPLHLRYEFFDPEHQFPIVVSAKLDGS